MVSCFLDFSCSLKHFIALSYFSIFHLLWSLLTGLGKKYLQSALLGILKYFQSLSMDILAAHVLLPLGDILRGVGCSCCRSPSLTHPQSCCITPQYSGRGEKAMGLSSSISHNGRIQGLIHKLSLFPSGRNYWPRRSSWHSASHLGGG